MRKQNLSNVSVSYFFYLVIYFLAVLGLHCCMGFSLVVVSGGYPIVVVCGLLIEVASLVFLKILLIFGCAGSSLLCGLLSSCGNQGLLSSGSARASHCRGCLLQSMGSRHKFSSHGTRAWLLRGLWNLPRAGIEPVSPALAGGFLTTGSPGKSLQHF